MLKSKRIRSGECYGQSHLLPKRDPSVWSFSAFGKRWVVVVPTRCSRSRRSWRCCLPRHRGPSILYPTELSSGTHPSSLGVRCFSSPDLDKKTPALGPVRTAGRGHKHAVEEAPLYFGAASTLPPPHATPSQHLGKIGVLLPPLVLFAQHQPECTDGATRPRIMMHASPLHPTPACMPGLRHRPCVWHCSWPT